MLLTRNPEICAAQLDGEVCLFNPESTEYLKLNATGSCIWTLLETPAGIDELVDSLQERYEVDPDTCRAQTELFINSAIEKGMLHTAPPI